MDGKVYSPEVIQENPFPGGLDPIAIPQQSVVDLYTPTITKIEPLPKKRVANELLSTSLNTKSRNILQEFELQDSGGFKVGNYQEGMSGDIRMTPNGLTARNKAGTNTFSIDGQTGDAIFSGDVRAATFTSDYFNVDSEGNVIANSIQLMSNTYKQVTLGSNETFTSGTQVDIANATHTIILERPTIILFLYDILGWVYQGVGSGSWGGNAIVRLLINNAEKKRLVLGGSRISSDSTGATSITSSSLHHLITLPAGTHTAKLTGACDQSQGTTYFRLYQWAFSYLSLGNG